MLYLVDNKVLVVYATNTDNTVLHLFRKGVRTLKNVSIGYCIIASALVWGAVIIGCSLKLKGTECYEQISNILIAGSAIHLIVIWPIAGKLIRKMQTEKIDISNADINRS